LLGLDNLSIISQSSKNHIVEFNKINKIMKR